MTTKTLVGPLPTVRFHDGTKVAYDVPRDTMDPRYRPCTDHHVACDCREAEMAEQIQELRGQLREAQEAARQILAGHATYAYEEGADGERGRPVGCMCTGCQIARQGYLLSHYEADRFARDEVDGLSAAAVDAGWRWKVCTPNTQTRHAGVCDWAYSRHISDRPYHEHVVDAAGQPVRAVRNDQVGDASDMEVPF